MRNGRPGWVSDHQPTLKMPSAGRFSIIALSLDFTDRHKLTSPQRCPT